MRWVTRVLLTCGLLGAAAAASLLAQNGPAGMIRDIASARHPTVAFGLGFGWGGPVVFAELGGALYFFTYDETHGQELWRSDGTAAGTHVVRDVCPGSCDGDGATELVVWNGALYFSADDGAHGRELWTSDGTPAGTHLVADIRPGIASSAPRWLTPTTSALYFSADDGVHGFELWSSDGTTAGTQLVADIEAADAPTTDHDGPADLIALGPGTLLFDIDDGVHGRELWRSDGTAAGTTLVEDIDAGSASAFTFSFPWPNGFYRPASAGGKVIFVADQVAWVTDGTSAGTNPLMSLPVGGAFGVDSLFGFDSVVLFRGPNADGTAMTLWRSDGTAAGTYPLGDSSNGGDQLFPRSFARWGSVVAFAGYQPATGNEPWVTDGTVVGTHLLIDVVAGPTGALDMTFSGLQSIGSHLFFPASDGVHGVEPWVTDGTPAGTAMIADVVAGSGDSLFPLALGVYPAVLGEHLLYRGFDADGIAVYSWNSTSGQLAEAQSVGERPGSALQCAFSLCPTMVPVAGGVAMVAIDAEAGAEPWITDGNPGGTSRLADLWPGPTWSTTGGPSRRLAELGSSILAIASDAVDSEALFAIALGTATKLTDASSSGVDGVVVWNGAAIFGNSSGLWRSDGTAAGTAQISSAVPTGDLLTGTEAVYVPTAHGPWRTDGTAAGTTPLDPGDDVAVDQMTVTRNPQGRDRIYYFASDATTGSELWVVDAGGLPAFRIADLRPGQLGSEPSLTYLESFPKRVPLLAALGSLVLFAAADGIHGEELWVSDGTPGNATLLEIAPGAQGSEPRWLTTVGDLVSFVADDGVHGREPWVTDGTPAGTHLVADVWPGPGSSGARELIAWHGQLTFAADDGAHGMELWQASPGGTSAALLLDTWPGPDPGSPQGLTVSGKKLFFFADDGVHGLEPWAWPVGEGFFADDFETGGTNRWSARQGG